jgi:hypothetical protein
VVVGLVVVVVVVDVVVVDEVVVLAVVVLVAVELVELAVSTACGLSAPAQPVKSQATRATVARRPAIRSTVQPGFARGDAGMLAAINHRRRIAPTRGGAR